MEEDKELVKPKNVFESLNCAIEGIIYAVRHQRHIRYFFAIAAVALLLSLVLNLPEIEFVLFSISIVILLFAELVNTAIETTIDIVCGKRYHALAKVAKDVSAGAVLMSSIGVFIMSYIIFSKYLVFVYDKIPLPAPVYIGMVGNIFYLSLQEKAGFVFGRITSEIVWYFPLLTFFLKTSLSLLIMLVITLILHKKLPKKDFLTNMSLLAPIILIFIIGWLHFYTRPQRTVFVIKRDFKYCPGDGVGR